MRLKRLAVNFLLIACSLRRLHGSRVQRLARAFLDEVDFQHMRDTQPGIAFSNRWELHEYVQQRVIEGAPVDFLEFGVYRGASIASWTSANDHPNSRFYGFDSFEGLPESWRPSQQKGHFDCEGTVPVLEDDRVMFVKGWFDETIPPFAKAFTARNRVVMHLDADLYSSTLLPLMWLNPALPAGTLLIFDEFYDREHEFKAFCDFVRVSRRTFRVVCQANRFSQVCIELS